MSYSLIIADDESKIIDLIRALGHWNELDIKIVDQCKNGEETYQSILHHKPDIALIDIVMPVYDGISIIEKTKPFSKNTLYIIISGYRHFEYAKSAIRLGVVDYLLKPLDEKLLNDTLKKACQQLEIEKKRNDESRQLKTYSEEKRIEAWQVLWRYVLSGLSAPSESMPWPQQAFSIDFPFHHPCFVCVAMKSNMDNLLSGNGSIFAEKVQESIKHAFDGRFLYLYYNDTTGQYIILSAGSKDIPLLRELLNHIYENICHLCNIYGRFDLYIGYSYTEQGVDKLPLTMLQAQAAILDRPICNSNVFEFDQPTDCVFKSDDDIDERERIAFQRAVKYLDYETAEKLYRKMVQRLRDICKKDIVKVLCMLSRIEEMAAAQLRNDAVDASHTGVECLRYTTINAIVEASWERIAAKMNEQSQIQQNHRSRTIEQGERYIRRYYALPLSLEEVAATVRLSPTYFSKLFKQETGKGFAQYLMGVRMDVAKKMLLETNQSIKQIAEQVGYPDEKYFQKVFKKQIGITPSAYRTVFQ